MRRYYYIIINSVCFDIWNPLISRIPQYREFICQIYTTKNDELLDLCTILLNFLKIHRICYAKNTA